ncbi:MAG: ABC transporter permease [Anaerolineaceae bacterium]|nr:ABC transporter permease [Anaerolineaceae bacterium]
MKTQDILQNIFNRLLDMVPTLLALVLAFLVASILLVAMGADPGAAINSMLQGAFGTENATAETLVKATPILFVAIGIAIAFRGGVINIGGEGQMIAGALAGITTTLVLKDAAGLVTIPLSLIMGFLAGAFYGGIAGFLRAYFGVNEILSTIMLNQVAVQLMNYLLNNPLLDPAEIGTNHIPKTARILADQQLPRLVINIPEFMTPLFGHVDLFARTRLHTGIIIAVVLAILTYVLLWRTTIGYRIRAVGQNERAARYAGINVKRQMMLSLVLAGGFAGLAGVVQVLGLQYRLQTDGSPAGFTASAGFNGIVAALFGGLNPIGAIPASAFFGGLLVGAQKMQRDLGVPAALITAINGLIVVFVVSSQIFTQRRQRRRASIAVAEVEAPAERAEVPTPAEEIV